jgi:hypothetical protein
LDGFLYCARAVEAWRAGTIITIPFWRKACMKLKRICLFIPLAVTGVLFSVALAAPVPTQQAYLKASNAERIDWFGSSVAVSANTVVIGAPQEDSDASGVNGDQYNNRAINSGAAYILVRHGTDWGHQAFLKASNTSANDRFGHSVAASGDTVVVGAFAESVSYGGMAIKTTAAPPPRRGLRLCAHWLN